MTPMPTMASRISSAMPRWRAGKLFVVRSRMVSTLRRRRFRAASARGRPLRLARGSPDPDLTAVQVVAHLATHALVDLADLEADPGFAQVRDHRDPGRIAAGWAIVLGHAVDPGGGLAAGALHVALERERAFLDLRRLLLGAVGRAPAVQVLALLRREKQASELFRCRRRGKAQQHQGKRDQRAHENSGSGLLPVGYTRQRLIITACMAKPACCGEW